LYKTIPITYEEHFENLVTKDRNPISFSVYIKISVRSDSAWYLNKKFSAEWYKMNNSPRFRTIIRDKASQYDMFQLTSQREILVKIEKEALDEMINYSNKIVMPITNEEVNIGSVQPTQKVLDEIANTAARVQNKNTQIAEGQAQDERKVAEEKRAIADMAYKNKMGLTTDQFVQLQAIKMYETAAGQGTTMIFGSVPGITLNK